MNCPNCLRIHTAGRRRTGPARTVTLVKLGEVTCLTGDSHKYRCPACRALYFFTTAQVTEDSAPLITIRSHAPYETATVG